MKKEKSKVIFSIIVALVTFALIITSILQSYEDTCNEELASFQYKVLKTDIESSFFFDFYSDISSRDNFDTLRIFRDLDKNNSINTSEISNTFNHNNEMMTNLLRLSISSREESDLLEKKLEDKIVVCNEWSLASKVALYIGLFLSLLSIYYGNKIKQLYKT